MNIFWDYEALTKEERIRENRKLVEKYPFLLPKNNWIYEPLKDYDYSWTLMDEIPRGWRIAFGKLFFDELKAELEKYDYLDKYEVGQVKEKYGSLRWYDNECPRESKVSEIVDKYEVLSENICINCGKPDVSMVNDSWISPYCEKCWIDIQVNYRVHKEGKTEFEVISDAVESYNELTSSVDRMSDELAWSTFDGKERFEHKVDISNTANKIRENCEQYQKYIKKEYNG